MARTNPPSDPTLLQQVSAEVAPEVSPLLRFLVENARRIGLVAIVCVLAAAAYGVYNWRADKARVQAQNDLGKILVTAEPAARLAKLREFQTAAPKALASAVSLAMASTAMESGDYAQAAASWATLAQDRADALYPTAIVGQAEALAAQNKAAEALDVLVAASLPQDSAANLLIQTMIADLAEKSGKYDLALQRCDAIIAMLDNPNEVDYWKQKAAQLREMAKLAAS